MKIHGTRRLAALLGDFLTLLWVGLWLATMAVPVLALLGVERGAVTFDVRLSPGSVSEAPGPGGTWTMRVTEGQVSLPLGKPWMGCLTLVPLFALMAFSLGQLRAIFRSLALGSPFIPLNARRLRWVGLAVLLFEAIRTVVTAAVVGPGLAELGPLPSINGVARVSLWPNLDTVFLGLAILVLAEVFRQGTRLQDEQALTV